MYRRVSKCRADAVVQHTTQKDALRIEELTFMFKADPQSSSNLTVFLRRLELIETPRPIPDMLLESQYLFCWGPSVRNFAVCMAMIGVFNIGINASLKDAAI